MGIEYDFSWWVWKCGSLYPVLLHIATMNCHECLNFHGKLMMASLYAKIMAALGAPWAPHFQQFICGTNCKRIPGEKNEQNSQIHWESWTHWENWQGVLQKLKVELHQLGFNQHYSAYRRDDMQVFTRIRLQIGEGPSLSWPLCMGKMKINQYCFGFQMVKTWTLLWQDRCQYATQSWPAKGAMLMQQHVILNLQELYMFLLELWMGNIYWLVVWNMFP